MAVEWHASSNGEKTGPFSFEKLQELANSEALRPEDLVWATGMSDWIPARKVKGLFQLIVVSCTSCGRRYSLPANKAGQEVTCRACQAVFTVATRPENIRPPKIGEDGVLEQQPEAAVQKAIDLTKGLGRAIAGAFTPQHFDEYAQSKGDATPAILVKPEFFGGRSRIASPMSAMYEPGFLLGAGLFSWFYILLFLQSATERWQFLPFSRTEFVRIVLRQRIMRQRVAPVFAVWALAMILVGLGARYLATHEWDTKWWLGLLGVGYVVANLAASAWLAVLGDNLKRTEISLEYGYPTKHRLLSCLSDAHIDEQIKGVLQLCEALSKVEFSPWEQYSAHGEDGIGGAVFSRLSRLLRTH